MATADTTSKEALQSCACPECGHTLALRPPVKRLGLVRCSNCFEILVIASVDPPQLQWALEFDGVPTGAAQHE